MNTLFLQTYIGVRMAAADLRGRLDEEYGEGVISTAIAVLIMALLGAAMWAAFRGIFDGASDKAGTAVDSIGN